MKKCPYCDFNSHQVTGNIPERDYVDALLKDFAQELPYVQNREIQSVFIGGGTPSLFSAAALGRLLDGLQKLSPFKSQLEVTLEANPGTAEAERFRQYRSLGINRISLGIQSFQDQQLVTLGRVHNSDEARRAIAMASSAGFDNFNLDLMYGLPQQTLEQALTDIDMAIGFGPTHLSWYQLTIEPNTVFYRKPPTLPDEEPLFEIHQQGLARIEAGGYQRYEVSAFAKPNRESVHNVNYWSFGDYLGIGAGAHSKLSLPEENRLIRSRKLRQPSQYLSKPIDFVAQREEIAQTDRVLEFLMNGLRLTGGIDTRFMGSRAGIKDEELERVNRKINELVTKELLERQAYCLKATENGYLFLNSLLQEFV